MRSLLSSAIALTGMPFMASAGQGVVPVDMPPQVSWIRQVNRTSVCSRANQYFGQFKTGSGEYSVSGAVPTWSDPEPVCIVERINNSGSGVDVPTSISGAASPAAKITYERHHLTKTPSAHPVVSASIIDDAMKFASLVAGLTWAPSVWSDDGEIVFEWIRDGRHAVVSLEGDGLIGYAMLVDGAFVSGSVTQASVSALPADLLEYIKTSA